MTYLQLDESWLAQAGALCTAREIAQQPATLLATQAHLAARAADIAAFLTPLLARSEMRVILTGAGSSAFIGECLAPFLSRALSRRIEAIATTDLLSGPLDYLRPDVPTLLVSFGRSGGSPESVAVVDLAERVVRECHQLIITCNENGALFQRCQGSKNALAIALPAETHDESFAMTSSFTAMLLAAWWVFRAPHVERADVAAVSRAVAHVLDRLEPAIKALAQESHARVVYLGSNGLQGLAREAALKLLEMSDGAVASISNSPLGVRHGPKTFITPGTLVFVFVSSDPYTRRYDLDLLEELRAEGRATRVIALTTSNDVPVGPDTVKIEALAGSEVGACFPFIVCAQLYAFHRSVLLGNSPDQPSRSGTVSRVVRGVTIHPL